MCNKRTIITYSKTLVTLVHIGFRVLPLLLVVSWSYLQEPAFDVLDDAEENDVALDELEALKIQAALAGQAPAVVLGAACRGAEGPGPNESRYRAWCVQGICY